MSGLTPKIVTGLPPETKARPRADIRAEELDQLILTKGYRVWWSRAGLCPCRNNDQTEQPNPICQLCHGEGHYYFSPDPAVAAGSAQDAYGNPVETNEEGDAVQIYAIMTSITKKIDLFERFGQWVSGATVATVQPGNRLGYYDRLVVRDSVMPWSQIIETDGGAVIEVKGRLGKTGLRYPLVAVHQLRSLAAVYREGLDFALTDDGAIAWQGAPPAYGTRLSIHGAIRPVWLVQDHVHSYRDTQVVGATMAIGDQRFTPLPVQAMCKLDFLIDP